MKRFSEDEAIPEARCTSATRRQGIGSEDRPCAPSARKGYLHPRAPELPDERRRSDSC
ncbi:hypothetical protein ebA6211 [Aromatoleum aromaticum EbN1]|uniref:Uncharacterized protein n=1 Tax=Aromatoleum aromaticum (strain DSM 19018 / LMG 30748 / EbN1) TaxID=76114 RepID=Q5NZ40_AROAE|nr:hypothetical protein ebA6211 [Aromatoleum aromaticum EbN1]